MNPEVLTVTEVRDFVNQTLSYAYPQIVVEGEVASFRINQGKWIFFDLKDKETTISCFMTKFQLNTVLEDGMLVRVTATPNLTKWGKFSLTVKYVELAGAGEVKLAFEKLKAQFEAEGLFAADRKRILPQYPSKIGLVTSTEAAAFNDFITIAGDRWPLLDILHTHVQVQGEAAVKDVVGAINWLNSNHPELEAIVVIRGGGSQEDLQVFNTEPVVRALYASIIPTIVGIGHEDDVSLAELVADVRAATPTDAARKITPDKISVTQNLAYQIDRQASALQQIINRLQRQIERVASVFMSVERLTSEKLDNACRRFNTAMDEKLRVWSTIVESAGRTLHGANPDRILTRGYAIARFNELVLTDPKLVSVGDTVMIQLRQGNLSASAIGVSASKPAHQSGSKPKPPIKVKERPVQTNDKSVEKPQTRIEFP